MFVGRCTCDSLDTGQKQEPHSAHKLHHAFCPHWTLCFNYLYSFPATIHGKTGDKYLPIISRYTMSESQALYGGIYFVLRHKAELYFLDNVTMDRLSLTVRKESSHNFTPNSVYLAIYRASNGKEQREIMDTYANQHAPLDLSSFSRYVVQAFTMFVHKESLLDYGMTDRETLLDEPGYRLGTTGSCWTFQWAQLWAVSYLLEMPALAHYALDAMGEYAPYIEREVSGEEDLKKVKITLSCGCRYRCSSQGGWEDVW